MRILILSDIHGNLAALDAVLDAARKGAGFGRVWVLGDTVGYGPQPNECIARVREMGALVISGNHEQAVTGRTGVEQFNPSAAAALLWTRQVIGSDAKAFIESLPDRLEEQSVTLVHGSPRDPSWEYLATKAAARDNLKFFKTGGCAFGHTHVPLWMKFEAGRATGGKPRDGTKAGIGDGRYYLNPGSVGQPRDGDPRASYAVLDAAAGSVTFGRAAYDIKLTQRLMADAGLPRQLADRLPLGR